MGERKSVGMVAHYSTTNYGNHLVNFAARRVLEKCGYDVDIIVFRGGARYLRFASVRRLPAKVLRLVSTGALRSRVSDRIRGRLGSGGDRSLGRVDNAARLDRFKAFSDVHLQPKFCAVEDRRDLLREYDMFAIGSDQIWNYDYDLGPWQFLDFADTTRSLCIAPSVGHDDIPVEWRGSYRRWLSRFNEIGVRELKWVDSVRLGPAGPDTTLLVDPTLMISRGEWADLATGPLVATESLLIYELGDLRPSEREYIANLSASHGLEVKHLSGRIQGPDWQTNSADFIAMVANSSCVVTDSYHGAIFAFIFDKPLVILSRHGFAGAMNSRIETLVDLLGLADRMIDTLPVDKAMTHDYALGRRSLAARQDEFWLYLERRGLSRTGTVATPNNMPMEDS